MNIKRAICFVSICSVTLLAYQNCAENQVLFTEEIELASSGAPVCRQMTADAVLPQLLYSWNYQATVEPDYKQVMASPVVGDLEQDGSPEILFVSYKDMAYSTKGVLRVLDGATGRIKFSVSDDAIRPQASLAPLLIDIDGDGKTEIIYLHHEGQKVIALNFDGGVRWIHNLDFSDLNIKKLTCYEGFSAADIDGDGKAEIIAGAWILKEHSPTNVVQVSRLPISSNACFNYAANLSKNPTGKMSILGTHGVSNIAGQFLFQFDKPGIPASADIRPDIAGVEVIVSGSGYLSIYNGLTGELIAQNKLSEHSDLICSKDSAGNGVVGGGQATVGDFDGNPQTLEIAVATGKSLTIFDAYGKKIAGSVTQDCSSMSTGLTSFDFNGDGKPEIIYSDERYVRIYEMDGSNNLKVIWEQINPSGTLREYPVIADVTGDGSAKLLVVANNMWADRSDMYQSERERSVAREITGLRVFGPRQANSWMPTRAVWNQHSYMASNVTDNLQATSNTFFNGSMPTLFKRNIQKGLFQSACVPE